MSLLDLVPGCEIVSAGPFLMGTPDAERSGLAKRYGGTRESYAEESPQHEVDLPAFAIMRAPVTNALYEQWVLATGAPIPLAWRGGVLQEDLRDHPVVDVSWDDAVAFAIWLSEQTGTQWELPTEAQWEKAARGDDGRQFPWGNTFDADLCNVRESARSGTTPVGMFPEGASPYGLLDVAGNVWEWTRTLQAPYPYEDDDRDLIEFAEPAQGRLRRALARLRRQSPANAPVDPRRILRGGCYANPEGFARCACRFRLAPNSRTPFLGFRLAHEV